MRQKLFSQYKLTVFLILAICLRAFMLLFKWPDFIYKTSFFNTNLFALSDFSPSLGDYVLNISLVSFAIFLFLGKIKKLDYLKYDYRVISFLAILVSAFNLFLITSAISQIYIGSQHNFNLRLNLSGSTFLLKLVQLLLFVLLSVTFFRLQKWIFGIIKSLWNIQKAKYYILGFTVIFAGFIVLFIDFPFYLLIAFLIYTTLIIAFDINLTLVKYHFKSIIYMVFSAIFLAFLGTYIDYRQEILADNSKKQQFAKIKTDENDPMAEFLIEMANESIKNSKLIQKELNYKTIDFEKIDKEIAENILRNWFDKYKIIINYYGKNGKNLKLPTAPVLEQNWLNITKNAENTLIENLFLLVNEQAKTNKKYVNKVEVEISNSEKITLLITFIGTENRVNNYLEKTHYNEFEYEIINEVEPKKLDVLSQNDSTIKLKNNLTKLATSKFNKKYTSFKATNGKIVLVSSPKFSFADAFSTFSFLFLILVLIFLGGYILLLYMYQQQSNEQSFSAKIQVYFGLAFIIPLFVSLVLIFNIIDNSYKKQELQRLETLAQLLENELITLFKSSNFLLHDQYFMENELAELAYNQNLNFAIFSTQGNELLKSNSPQFYEKKIDAYILAQLKEKQSFLVEKGSYQVYYKIITNMAGVDLCIFSLPFTIKSSLENKDTSRLFGSILSAFAIIFLLFLGVSIIASTHLIKPLGIITNYLQKTDLNTANKPIYWNENDEIGQLVQGYNSMLVKIEESKKQIIQTEKQTAWQDMAKQVAHEIKNPLTPMKLTLQHLENTLKKDGEIKKEQIIKSFSSLIYNIDNISEIIDSFMRFAQMPMPKNTKIDFLKPIKAVFELYASQNEIKLVIEPKLKKAMILGDEKLLYQIINNLIINALQSIQAERQPEIKINFSKVNTQYQLSIADNGAGISDELRKKVFMPKFTTKEGGSGIGLSLAKWGIENMNGKIFFETEMGHGTTFFIQIPEILS